MKISNSSNIYYSNFLRPFDKQVQQNRAVSNTIETSVPVETLKAYSFGVSVKKRDDLYSNTEKFAEYFEDKLKKQMQVKSEEDIQNIIDNIVNETNTDGKTVCEVLSRVVQFSDYSNIDDLEFLIREKGYDACKNKIYNRLSVALPFTYLFNKQQFMNLPKVRCIKITSKKPVQILDNSVLKYMADLDKNSTIYSEYKETLSSGVIIDGWNTLIDGKNMAYTMFGHEYDLQTITTSIIKEMQKTGKSLDEVLNGDIINECKKHLGEDFEPVIIKKTDEPVLTANAISEVMKPKMPNKDQIVKFIDVIAKDCEKKSLDPSFVKPLICKYLDVTFEAYSSERINSEMKNMHKMIEKKVKSLGKTMDDVVYIYPQRRKSFSLLSYQYALANNIPFEKFKNKDGSYSSFEQTKQYYEKGKVYVVLDDVTASGESLYDSQFYYLDFLKNIDYDKNTNVIWAPLYSSKEGKDFLDDGLKDQKRVGVDFLLTSQVRDWDLNLNDHFSYDEKKKMETIVGGKGFNEIATSVVFPFSVTDSDSRLSALFSTFFIRYPNEYKISSKITEGWHYEDFYTRMTRKIGTYNEYDPMFL